MRLILLAFLLLFWAQSTEAQESEEENQPEIITQKLDEVIVSATRTVRQLSSLPLPAQIIKKSEIVNINAMRLSELLNEQTGLVTVPDFGGGEGIQLQGLDSHYTLVLVDGVPLIGRSAGTLDLNRISLGNVKSIEIVKGASSSLYGSEALGGVINIITENPKTGFGGFLNHRSGTFNTNDTGLNLDYKKNNFGITAFVNRYETDGYDLNSDDPLNTVDSYENYTITTKLNYKPNEDTELIASGRFFTQDQNTIALEEFTGESSINEWNTRLFGQHQFNTRISSTLELYGSGYRASEFLEDPEGNPVTTSEFDQLLLRPELRTSYTPNDQTEITGGLGMNHESLDRSDFSSKPIFNSPYIFLQYDRTFSDKFNLIVGARFDSHNEYKSQFSPKVAMRYDLGKNLAVKGSVGYGFKAPDFRQLYFNFSNGVIGYTILGYNAVSTVLPELEEQGQIANILVPLSEFDGQLSPVQEYHR